MKFTDKDGEILADIAVRVGLDPYKIKNENPHKHSGKTADLLKMGSAEFYPEVNARWRSEVSSISAGTIAECRSGGPLSQRAIQDLYDHDPAFVREFHQKDERNYEAQLQQMEAETAEKRFRNTLVQTGGDEGMARRVIAAEDAEQAAREQQRQGVMS